MKTKLAKLTALLLALICVTALASCGNANFEDPVMHTCTFENYEYIDGRLCAVCYVCYGKNSVDSASELLKFRLVDNAYIVDGISKINNDYIIDIPAEYDGLPVTGIGDEAFYGSSHLTAITIPDSITSIGDNAFGSCNSLSNVTIGNVAASIGEEAFSNCPVTYLTCSVSHLSHFSKESLKSVVITGGESIPNAAFSGCTQLTGVIIPDSITNIGEDAFSNCENLSGVIIPEGVTNIGKAAFLGCSKLTGIILPNRMTTIEDYAFYQCVGLTSITIPDSVTDIGESAFGDCYNIKNVTIGNGIKKIGGHAFATSSNIEKVHISDLAAWCSIDFDNGFANPLEDANELYVNGKLITELVIPEEITKVHNYAFYGYESLESITIPNSVTSIGEGAFNYCTNVTSITVGNGLTSVGSNAFYSSGNISYNEYDNAYYLGNNDNLYVVLMKAKDQNITSCEINSSTRIIHAEAFYNCDSLSTIIIPDSVTCVGDGAFAYCGLESATIGNAVTSINNYTFYCCNLRSITIPESVTNIGQSAFGSCFNLTAITIPDSVTSIGDSAFDSCGLESITIGKGVTSIGKTAFRWCCDLTNITVDENNTVYKSIDGNLYTIDENKLIQYAIGKASATFSIPDSVTSIDEYAFSLSQNLTSVIIGKGVIKIGDNAFERCNNISAIAIPDNVTSIGDYAFYYCENLTNITIGKGVTSIGRHAFYECGKLVNAMFATTTGWYLHYDSCLYEDICQGESVDVTDALVNAENLVSAYSNNYWKRV